MSLVLFINKYKPFNILNIRDLLLLMKQKPGLIDVIVEIMVAAISLYSMASKFTESQNERGWRGSLDITQSSPPANTRVLRSGCTRMHPGGF